MKSHPLVLVSIALLTATQLRAQEGFYLGATVGGSSTHLSGDIPEGRSYTSKTGFSAGVIAEYAPWKDIRLSVQPSYALRGTGIAFDVGEPDPRDSLEVALHYLSIPFMARFLSSEESWFVNGGFEFNVLLDAKLRDISTDATTDVRNVFHDVDIMMMLGVGKNFPIKPMILSCELRYAQSIINGASAQNTAAANGMSPRFRSSGFQLLVAVLYPF